MNLLKLVMTKDQEYGIIDLIGQHELAHFVDVNEEKEVYKRPYTEMIRRCDEAERKTLFVINQCKLHYLTLKKCKFVE